MYANAWSNRLVEDNSPLRAVINGKNDGRAEDFYDFPDLETTDRKAGDLNKSG